MKLEEVTTGASLDGVEPSSLVTVVAALPIPPDALHLVYRLSDGPPRERNLVTSWSAVESAAGEVPESNEQLKLFGGEP